MKWPFILAIIIFILLFLTMNTVHKNTVHKNMVEMNTVERNTVEKNTVEINTVNTEKAICFLSASFSDKLYEFVKELAKDDTEREYDFYICIDKGVEINNNDENISLLFVDGKSAEEKGFKSSVLYFQGRACSRDKALYYFSIEKPDVYDNVWMIEDDVFFYNLETIRRLDRRYPSSDLITKQFDIVRNEHEKNKMSWDNWHFLNDKIGFPWTKGMISVIRVSSLLLATIRDYALKNKTLLFDESMFTTFSLHYNLTVETPDEFQEVFWNDNINWNYLNSTHFLHPVKDISFHEKLRHNITKLLDS